MAEVSNNLTPRCLQIRIAGPAGKRFLVTHENETNYGYSWSFSPVVVHADATGVAEAYVYEGIRFRIDEL